MPATISIGIDPSLRLGPITLAWHGLTIALGILAGAWLAAREARRRGLDSAPLTSMALILVAGAVVGSRLFYLAEHGGLTDPREWLGVRGFTFYGGFMLAAAGLAIYVARTGLPTAYLDIAAAALPLGYAIGRIGDVINGEHYGPATTFWLGVRNTHPDASVPSPFVAYHSGGLYEVMIGLAVFAIAWPLRRRFDRPWAMVCVVVGLLAAGRFIAFFARSDSASGPLGLETAQWVSVTLMITAVVGLIVAMRGSAPR